MIVADRYEVIESIGAGTSGTVYLAKDRDLERKIALKIYERGSDELRRQALARANLAHPNIVTVYEVGEHEGKTFVAMEYVAGSSLRAWLAAEKRTVDEILDVLLAAADGTIAAHDAKLLDDAFDADHILIGKDGRTRITRSGDQQAFCRVAIEALPSPPRRIRRVLERGRAHYPSERFPSLPALVAALRGARSRSRLVIASAGLVVLAAGATVALAWPASEDPNDVCRAAGMSILTIGLDTPARVAHGGFPKLAPIVERRLAKYRASQLALANTVCRNAIVDKTWSMDLYRRGASCLDEARRVATAVLTWDPNVPLTVNDLLDRAARLGGESVCADATVLASSPALPDDPADREEVIRVRVAIETALANYGADRLDGLDRAAATAAASRMQSEASVVPRIDALRGYILVERGHLKEGEALLAKAYYGARAIDDPGLALGIMTALVNTASTRLDTAAIESWVQNALADVTRMQARAPRSAGRLYAVLAATFDSVGDPKRGMDLLGQAFPLLGDEPSTSLADALMTRASLSISLGKPDTALADYRRAIEIITMLYGPDHPLGAKMKITASAGFTALGRRQEAIDLAREGEAILDRNLGSATRDTAQMKLNLGVGYANAREYVKARKFLTEARTETVRVLGPDHPDVLLIDSNLAYISVAEKDFATALKLAYPTLLAMEKVLPDPHEDRGGLMLTIADAARGLNDTETAIQAAEASAEQYPEGDERKVLSLAVGAMVANDTGQGARALKIVEKMRALPPPSDPVLVGRTLYEYGRGLANTKGGDRAKANGALTKAETVFSAAGFDEWAAEAAAARAKLK